MGRSLTFLGCHHRGHVGVFVGHPMRLFCRRRDAAEAAAARKHVKYACIATTHACIPVTVESMRPLGHEASEFLTYLGRHLSLIINDICETSHLIQRISVLIQQVQVQV